MEGATPPMNTVHHHHAGWRSEPRFENEGFGIKTCTLKCQMIELLHLPILHTQLTGGDAATEVVGLVLNMIGQWDFGEISLALEYITSSSSHPTSPILDGNHKIKFTLRSHTDEALKFITTIREADLKLTHPWNENIVRERSGRHAVIETFEGSKRLAFEFPSRKWIRKLHSMSNSYGHEECIFEICFRYETRGPDSFVSPTTTPPRPRFLDIFSRHDYFHLLKAFLDVRSIRNLQATSKALRYLLQDIISARVREELGFFFPGRLIEFRDCLRQTGAVVSGSTALRCMFFDVPWARQDLDILLGDMHVDVFIRFLENNGYHRQLSIPAVTNMHGAGEPSPDAWRYFAYDHAVSGRKIDLCISSQRRPGGVLNAVLRYHSSVVMNFISGWRMGCFFPQLTFAGKNLKNLEQRSRLKAERALEKYGKRGFPLVTSTRQRGRWGELHSIQSFLVDAKALPEGSIPLTPNSDVPDFIAKPSDPDPEEFYEMDVDNNGVPYLSTVYSSYGPLALKNIETLAWGTFISFDAPNAGEWVP